MFSKQIWCNAFCTLTNIVHIFYKNEFHYYLIAESWMVQIKLTKMDPGVRMEVKHRVWAQLQVLLNHSPECVTTSDRQATAVTQFIYRKLYHLTDSVNTMNPWCHRPPRCHHLALPAKPPSRPQDQCRQDIMGERHPPATANRWKKVWIIIIINTSFCAVL